MARARTHGRGHNLHRAGRQAPVLARAAAVRAQHAQRQRLVHHQPVPVGRARSQLSALTLALPIGQAAHRALHAPSLKRNVWHGMRGCCLMTALQRARSHPVSDAPGTRRQRFVAPCSPALLACLLKPSQLVSMLTLAWAGTACGRGAAGRPVRACTCTSARGWLPAAPGRRTAHRCPPPQ